ncbi:MAG: hypothetical protein U0935_07745 [Pirellulales bacterium]
MTTWRCALELDARRQVVAGSTAELVDRISRAADLRISTEFLHNEHIDVASPCSERILEVAEFGITYCIDQTWVAGIMSLRQPIELPVGFGPRPSLSLFLYNQDGTQAIARPYLDGGPANGQVGPAATPGPRNMSKYHVVDSWDAETNAPSQNFVYDFDRYRYCVLDSWREVLRHSADGTVISGSLDELVAAFAAGCAIKLGIRNLCDDLADASNHTLEHEVFVQGGSAYYYTERRLFLIGSHPLVRVRPSKPLRYASRNWDFGWLLLRSDGHVVYRRCDPYTLRFSDRVFQCPIRWFVR